MVVKRKPKLKRSTTADTLFLLHCNMQKLDRKLDEIAKDIEKIQIYVGQMAKVPTVRAQDIAGEAKSYYDVPF